MAGSPRSRLISAVRPIIVGVGFGAVAALLLFLGLHRWRVPRIHFDTTTFDAGTISDPTKRTVKCQFSFANVGTAPLKIGEIRTSCGCTVAALKKRDYAPGERGQIDVSFTLSTVGKNVVSVEVPTNGADAAPPLLVMGAYVPNTAVSLAPQKVFLTGSKERASSTVTIEVLSSRREAADTVAVGTVRSAKNMATATVSRRVVHATRSALGYFRTTFELKVVPSEQAEGDFDDVLTIDFAPYGYAAAEIRVDGRSITPDSLSIFPRRMLFVFSRRDRNLDAARVSVQGIAGAHLDMAHLENPFSEWLDVAPADAAGNGHFELVLTPRKLPSLDRADAAIQIVLRDAAGAIHTVSLPVTAQLLP